MRWKLFGRYYTSIPPRSKYVGKTVDKVKKLLPKDAVIRVIPYDVCFREDYIHDRINIMLNEHNKVYLINHD